MYGVRDFSAEQALFALQHHNFNIYAALKQMFENPLPARHDFDKWEDVEKQTMQKCLKRYGKDFSYIANQIKTRGFKDVVSMYYDGKSRDLYRKRAKPSSARCSTFFLPSFNLRVF